MTGRERLKAVLRKRSKDRLPWTTLVDDAVLALLPESLRGNCGIDCYKHLGNITAAAGIKAEAILQPVTEFVAECSGANVTLPPASLVRVTCKS